MKYLKASLLVVVCFLTACGGKVDHHGKTPLVEVDGTFLYKEDLKASMPIGCSKEDSLLFAENYIRNWIEDILLYNKAKNNISESQRIEDLVQNYRKSLIIHEYQQKLINQELTANLLLKKGMRVLDLGCGRGLTSVFLAKKFDVEVFAVDLWTSPTENYSRFQQAGVSHLTVPLQFDALHLPFAEGFFDAVVSVDAYHYFGNNNSYFTQVLKPILKKDALVAIAFPGMKYELHENIPEEMKVFWEAEALEMWHSIDWWRPKFAHCLKDFQITEMDCFDRAWNDWLSCDNPYAVEDRLMIETDNGRFMNLIKITGSIC